MNCKYIFTLLLIILPFCNIFASDNNDNTFPTPERLFHIARSANKNIICYDYNLENGKLNLQSPLKVYWVNREEHMGATEGLSYIQRKLAYGYKVVQVKQNSSICTLSAYPKRKLTITRYKSGYACLVKINNQWAELKSLYVKARPYNPLKVEYIELHGVSLSTHSPITERINNN